MPKGLSHFLEEKKIHSEYVNLKIKGNTNWWNHNLGQKIRQRIKNFLIPGFYRKKNNLPMALNAQMKGGEKKAKIKLIVDTTNMLMGKRIRSSIVPKAPLRTYWTNLWTTRTTSLDINPVSGLLSKSFLFCEMWFHKLSILEIKQACLNTLKYLVS